MSSLYTRDYVMQFHNSVKQKEIKLHCGIQTKKSVQQCNAVRLYNRALKNIKQMLSIREGESTSTNAL